MPQRSPSKTPTPGEFTVFAGVIVFLAAGIVTTALAGAVPSRTGYGAGLMLILLAAITAVGGGALYWHRRHHEETAGLRDDIARLEEEVKDMRCEVRLVMAAVTQRADQLAERRNGLG
jgi:hypothetical protein